ncbi:MAG: hypothetical protein V2A34_15470, partial [Lentisphaerota bacterium]
MTNNFHHFGLWITAAGLMVLSLQTPAAQEPKRQQTSWSSSERAFLETLDKVRANPNDVGMMKTLTETSQQLLNYYIKGELQIDPYDY